MRSEISKMYANTLSCIMYMGQLFFMQNIAVYLKYLYPGSLPDIRLWRQLDLGQDFVVPEAACQILTPHLLNGLTWTGKGRGRNSRGGSVEESRVVGATAKHSNPSLFLPHISSSAPSHVLFQSRKCGGGEMWGAGDDSRWMEVAGPQYVAWESNPERS